jgi:tungstate transport system ATP-binding protein
VAVVRDARPILRIPALTISAGQTTAVVGPSGAGKSTLLRLLARLEAPSEGEVWSQGPDGRPLLPGQVVMVFQRPLLLRATVEENVAVGLRLQGARAAGSRVSGMLERIGLAKKRRQPALLLSGGEHQRVALARALVLEPAALLLDEPTANLDPYNVALIEALVKETRAEHGSTVVWVTHNPIQAGRIAERAILLLDGKVVEQSETEVFFSAAAAAQTQAFLAGRIVW